MQLNAITFEAQNREYIQNLKYFWTLLYKRTMHVMRVIVYCRH